MADYIPLTAETEAPKPAAPRPDARDDIRGRAGVAPIKSEYVLPIPPRPVMDDDAAERGDSRDARDRDSRDDRDGDRGGKRQKTKTGWKGRTSGQKRPKPEGEAAVRICKAWESQGECPRGDECKYAHSWAGYFEVKPVDTHFEHAGALADSEPYLRDVRERAVGGEDTVGKTIDLATECPVFKDLGYCPYGWRCRFLGGHVRKTEGEGDGVFSLPGWELQGRAQVEGEAKAESSGTQEDKYGEVNWPNWDVLRALKANKYEWRFTPKYLKKVEPDKVFQLAIPKGQGDGGHGKKGKGKWGKGKNQRGPPAPVTEEGAMNGSEGAANGEEAAANGDATNGSAPTEEAAMNAETNGVVDGEAEAIDVPLRPEEKRRLNWDNGLYLAPLTTVGNLPFRRLCTDYGATITISEMALAQPLVTGQSEEWALVRRHKSERMFGVQLAGGFANRMVPTAEVLARELGPSGVDFVDVNMGCPIDMLFNQGAGSALMENPGRLGKILVGMNRALGEIPLTVKFRMGVYNGKPNAHKLIPRFATEWGAGAMTLHGRSRQQRYSKLADWDYVRECVDVLRDTVADAGMAPVPLFGNGDCFSAQSYWETKERTGVDGIMLARGALIKPWIFTEVAERREWDISATERLEGIRKFAEYGLSHWGSDTMGVNTTRRFLCEALSFQHRYIPIGLLERMPPMINERPPAYKGRSELETLLASPFVGDWIKISEMFLGPVDERFTFAPKHKSSAYGNEEAQG